MFLHVLKYCYFLHKHRYDPLCCKYYNCDISHADLFVVFNLPPDVGIMVKDPTLKFFSDLNI